MMVRTPESGLLESVAQEGAGFIAFSPLAQGLLSDRYLKGIPMESRLARNHFLKAQDITAEKIALIESLNEIAQSCDMTLAQMATKWLLREGGGVTSVLIGASRTEQVKQLVEAVKKQPLSSAVLAQIESILSKE